LIDLHFPVPIKANPHILFTDISDWTADEPAQTKRPMISCRGHVRLGGAPPGNDAVAILLADGKPVELRHEDGTIGKVARPQPEAAYSNLGGELKSGLAVLSPPPGAAHAGQT
jgi:hypothetical protein